MTRELAYNLKRIKELERSAGIKTDKNLEKLTPWQVLQYINDLELCLINDNQEA